MRERYYRYGTPRTEAERRRRHHELYGDYRLPPRGYGRIQGEYTTHFFRSVVMGMGFAVGAYVLYKLTRGTIGSK